MKTTLHQAVIKDDNRQLTGKSRNTSSIQEGIPALFYLYL